MLLSSVAQPASLRTIGYSREGRPIQIRTLGSGPTSILIIGGVHGDESPSVPLLLDFLQDAETNPTRLDGLTLHFLIEANPDGGAAKTRTNAAGVDINRNMEFQWSSKSRSKRTFPGMKPYSEPETVVIRRVIQGLKPTRILSIHGFADILDFDTDDGKRLAELMAARNQMQVKTIGYPTPGSLGRYCTHHNIPLVTLEVKRGLNREEMWQWQREALWAFVLAQ